MLGEESSEEGIGGLGVIQPEEHGLLVVVHGIGIL